MSNVSTPMALILSKTTLFTAFNINIFFASFTSFCGVVTPERYNIRVLFVITICSKTFTSCRNCFKYPKVLGSDRSQSMELRTINGLFLWICVSFANRPSSLLTSVFNSLISLRITLPQRDVMTSPTLKLRWSILFKFVGSLWRCFKV